MAWGGLTAEYYGLTAGYYCTSILVQAEAGLVMKAGGYGRKWDVLLALVGNVCRWPTMTIRELTMAAADSALAADPLFHLGPGGHVGRIAVRYWYFRPELKYLTFPTDDSRVRPSSSSCTSGPERSPDRR
jgi:hypothetical protein